MFRSSDQSSDNGDCQFVQCHLVSYIWPTCQPKKILLSYVVFLSVIHLSHRINCSKGMFWEQNNIKDIRTQHRRCNMSFLLNNQPDALVIQFYSVIKLYMFRAYSLPIIRSFSTVHSAPVSFMQVYIGRFQAESGWNCGSILTLLGSGHQKPAWNLSVPNVQ